MSTLNQIITQIKTIAEDHAQINTLYFGPPLDILGNQDVNYPLFCVDISDMPVNGKEQSFPFRMWWLDIARADKSNEQEILSDMLLVSNDFLASLDYLSNSEDWMMDRNVPRQRIKDDTPDGLAGILADVTLKSPITYDKCQVPESTRIFTKEFSDVFV